MITFPTLSKRPDQLQIGLEPNLRLSESQEGGVKAEVRPGSVWSILIGFNYLNAADTATLEADLVSATLDGCRFMLPPQTDLGAQLFAAFSETAGKASVLMQFMPDGVEVTHVPAGMSTVTLDMRGVIQ